MALALTPGYRPIHDDASYARDALSLLRAGRYPMHRLPHGALQVSAYRPPGWPLALWGLWRVTGPSVPAARVLLAALGAVAAVLAALLARRLWSRREGLAAGALVACCPLLVAVGASLESETLFGALVLGAVAAALAARGDGRLRWALLAGALAGLAALTRTNGLLAVPAVALLAAHGRRPLVPALAATLVAVALVVPWTVRNAERVHVFAPVSTETGNTLAGTYNPVSLRAGARWLDPGRHGVYRAIYRRYGPAAQADPKLRAAVWRWVERHPAYPAEVAAADTARLLGLTGPGWAAFSLRTMSLGGAAGALVWAGVLACSALALAGMWRARRDGVPLGLWLLLGALFVPVALVNGELRLGAPAQQLALVFAGPAVAAAWTRRPVRSRR